MSLTENATCLEASLIARINISVVLCRVLVRVKCYFLSYKRNGIIFFLGALIILTLNLLFSIPISRSLKIKDYDFQNPLRSPCHNLRFKEMFSVTN